MTGIHVPTYDGRWVNENFARLAEILRDYDPGLELCWIPPDQRKDPQDHTRAYAVVHNTPTSRYVALYASEGAEPTEVLARIFMGDRRKTDVISVLDAREAAQKAFEYKEELERREEMLDQVKFFANTKKNYIKHKTPDGTVVKLDDQFRRLE